MPLKLLCGAALEGRPDFVNPRVGEDDVASTFELVRPVEVVDLDLAADALRPLAPLQLDRLQVVLRGDVIGGPEPCILHVQLHQEFPVAVPELPVGLDPAIHLGRPGDPAVVIEHQPRVDAADVLPADERDARYGCSDGEVFPVRLRNLGRAERPGEDRHPHRHLALPPVLRPGIDGGEDRGVGIALNTFRQPFCAPGVALDVQVRVVDRVVLICAGRDLAERAGVEHLSPPKRGEPDLAGPLAPVDAPAADAGHGNDIAGAVGCTRRIVGVRSSQVHRLHLYNYR